MASRGGLRIIYARTRGFCNLGARVRARGYQWGRYMYITHAAARARKVRLFGDAKRRYTRESEREGKKKRAEKRGKSPAER